MMRFKRDELLNVSIKYMDNIEKERREQNSPYLSTLVYNELKKWRDFLLAYPHKSIDLSVTDAMIFFSPKDLGKIWEDNISKEENDKDNISKEENDKGLPLW